MSATHVFMPAKFSSLAGAFLFRAGGFDPGGYVGGFGKFSGFEFADFVGGEPSEALLDTVDLACNVYRVQTVPVSYRLRNFLVGEDIGAQEPIKRGRKLSLIHISEPTRPY